MVPLSPGDRFRPIVRRRHPNDRERLRAIQRQADSPFAVRRVWDVHRIGPCLAYVDGDVDPLPRLGPTDVKRTHRRLIAVKGIVIDAAAFGVGDVDALVHPEFMQRVPIDGVEHAASVVDPIGIVVGDTLPAEVVIRALHLTGDHCGTDDRAIRERPALVAGEPRVARARMVVSVCGR